MMRWRPPKVNYQANIEYPGRTWANTATCPLR
jgi:hypothetical protein